MLYEKWRMSLLEARAAIKIPINWSSLIPKPPSSNSSITQKELQTVKRMANNRSKSDLQLIKQVDDDPSSPLKDVLKKHNLTFPKKDFDKLYKILQPIVLNLKRHFARPRPYALDRSIKAIDSKTHKNYLSYPSGHVAYAALSEKLLSKKYPEHKEEFEKALSDVGKARMLMGVHYISDNEAGEKLVNKLWPVFEKELVNDKS